MAHTIEAAGYIVSDDMAIWGMGATEEAAWADMVEGMRKAGIEVLDDAEADRRYDEHGHSNDATTLRSDFKCDAATAALMDQVEARGGCIAWGDVGKIACTRDEEDAAAEAAEVGDR